MKAKCICYHELSVKDKETLSTLCPLGNFSCIFVVCGFFFQINLDLGPICLKRFSADDTRRQRVKTNSTCVIFFFAPGYLIIYKYMMIGTKQNQPVVKS